MNKTEVQISLTQARQAREQWGAARQEFFSGYTKTVRRLLHEAVANYMAPREIAQLLGIGHSQVRKDMRAAGLDPKQGRRVLADSAAAALVGNAELLGIDPSQMDLTSPLAYLPAGEALRREVQDRTISQVHEFPETEPDLTLPMADRRCQCRVPASTGTLNGGVEVCQWCSYIIEPA